MNNSDKSKQQLLKEVEPLSTKIGKLEKSEIDHKLAEIALKESEEKFRVLYESSQDAIMMLAPPTWLFTAGNQATIKMFHAKDEEEFISKEPWELSPEYQPDGQLSSEKAKKMIQKAMKTGSNFFEWTHNKIKGEDFPATVLLTRIELKDKQLLQATVRDITKRKRIEEELNKHQQQLEKLVDERTKELKEKKEYYQSFVTSLNDWVWEMDLKGIHTYSNPTVESILGYKVEDIIGHHVSELWLDNTKTPKYLNSLKNTLALGKGWKNFPGRFKHKNGSLVITESTAIPIYNLENKLVGYRGLDHDITDRKQAEKALLSEKEFSEKLIDTSSAIIVGLDKDHLIQIFNKGAEKITGYKTIEVIGKDWFDIFFPTKIINEMKKVWKDAWGIVSHSNVNQILTKTGEIRIISWQTTGMYDGEDNTKKLLISFGEDITERKQAEERVKAEFKRFQITIDAIDAVIYVADMQTYELLFSNKAFNNLFGEHRSKQCYSVIQKGQTKPCDFCTNHLLLDKRGNIKEPYVWEFQNTLTKKWSQLSDQAILWPDGRIVRLEVATDITERKQAEEDLRIGRERLAILNKIIRHDLSNDFMVIKSAINLYKSSSEENMIDEIEGRVKKSLKTIENYRKYETFISSNADLSELEITEMIHRIVPDFPKIKFKIEGDCKVFADEALSAVFKNLISNSIKHGEATKIDIKITSENNMCEIRFMDNGKGIPDKVKHKIFNEGFSFGKSGNTGIGLHLVKETIDRYGGYVYAEDNKPKGSVFVISLRKVLKSDPRK